MTKTASKKQTTKKTPKTESKYYIVNSMNSLSKQVTEFAQKYNDKLVIPSVEATRETLDLMRKDPKKALIKIKDDGRELAEDIRDNVDSKVHDWMEDGKDLFVELSEDPREVVGDYLKDGRKWADCTFSDVVQVIENLAKDGKTMVADVRSNPSAKVDDLLQAGKKYIEGLPGLNTVEDQVEKAVHWMAEPLKLSTKSDLKKLVNAMEKLNKKVDTLSDRLPG